MPVKSAAPLPNLCNYLWLSSLLSPSVIRSKGMERRWGISPLPHCMWPVSLNKQPHTASPSIGIFLLLIHIRAWTGSAPPPIHCIGMGCGGELLLVKCLRIQKEPCWSRQRTVHLQHSILYHGQPGAPGKPHKWGGKAGACLHSCSPQKLVSGDLQPLDMEVQSSHHG